ncbi:MAG: UbiD family decarboxylase [Candidatus Binatia bacterium]|jgi:4-hydroxy-3-polyprenylbenzoate decarboxylase|nr:UbiD family decarboxylase [Candidatus Binatia bacterium]
MIYNGLRDWLEKVDRMGELKRLKGVDWNLEMGAVVDVLYREHPPYPPAILFDKIKDHAEGFRALFGHFASPKRIALTLGITQEFDHILEFVRVYHDKIKGCVPIPMQEVKSGAVHENVQEGDQVNLLALPAPFLHEKDGGRYRGTGHLVITKDPDTNWVNAGAYRMMLHNHNTAGIYIGPGKHGNIHRQKYFEKGRPLPVTVALGSDPLVWFAACCPVAAQVSEFDFAGGLAGEPVKVVHSDITGLPYPADAEIVLEGEMRPGEFKEEGPFGEWPGYYASARRQEPFMRVQRVLHRNAPILSGANPARPPHPTTLLRAITRSAHVWEELEKAGVPDVTGVWSHEPGPRQFTVVAIKQKYPGHAKQAGVLAAQCFSGGYQNRFTIVVDDDIDPARIQDVIWALSTRCDPETDIDITRRSWSSSLDPMIPPDSKVLMNSRAVVDACRPYDWLKDFPEVAETSPELRRKVLQKFGRSFFGLG